MAKCAKQKKKEGKKKYSHEFQSLNPTRNKTFAWNTAENNHRQRDAGDSNKEEAVIRDRGADQTSK